VTVSAWLFAAFADTGRQIRPAVQQSTALHCRLSHYSGESQGMSTAFREPPWLLNYEGKPRRVGVEIEMAGVDAEDIAGAVCAEVGGRFEQESAFAGSVHSESMGEFRIELDADLFTSRGYLSYLKKLGIEITPGELRDTVEDLLSRAAGLVVPHELVCPPLPISALPTIDRIQARLRAAGAKGTEAAPFYAFGLQFNVELHERSAPAILSVLRAFLLRYESLLELSEVDFARQISPYVHPYPEDYAVYVLQPDYAPDLVTLIDDFLYFTPTRNRPLDLLPLLAWLDRERVMAAPVERNLIKPRPAWHYRLPNCQIDRPDWSIAPAWNDWIMVEELAADPTALRRETAERLQESHGVKRWLAAFWRQFRRNRPRS
jgi:hypothetical protein